MQLSLQAEILYTFQDIKKVTKKKKKKKNHVIINNINIY